MNCPNCNVELHGDFRAEILKKHRVSIKITPGKGSLMEATSIGKIIELSAKLFKSVNKDLDVKVVVFVEKISSDDAGEVTVDFLISRLTP